MNKFSLLPFLLIPVVCFSANQSVSFKNSSGNERKDEVIILTRKQLSEKITIARGLPAFKENGKYIPSQADDLNGDGAWDEVVIVADFGANETKTFAVEFVSPDSYPEFEKRTNVRLGIIQEDKSYKEVDEYQALPCNNGFKVIAQAESVSWENDKMGFRVYFDCRNVKDLFGKLQPGLIIDKVGTPELKSYHNLSDWGMDILHCGSSLGSGGLALLKGDSLYRLGSTSVYKYRKICEGPVRSMFDLIYKGWEVDNIPVEAVERISVYPGKYWFQSDVTFTGCPEGSQVVTGIVTSLLKREPFALETKGFRCIGTHDIQSLNKDELGMAVLVPEKESGKIGRTTDINFFKLGFETVKEKSFSNIISQTYYIGQKCKSGETLRHWFFAVWGLEKNQWKTEEGFKEYIQNESKKFSQPVKML